MIVTLAITVIIESAVIIAYAQRHKKPILPLLVTGLLVNSLTQSLLWLTLLAFPTHYLLALSVMEALIVGIELLVLRMVPANRLAWKDAFLLSLGMNLASIVIGWFLPV